jgi:hypothetical protein
MSMNAPQDTNSEAAVIETGTWWLNDRRKDQAERLAANLNLLLAGHRLVYVGSNSGNGLSKERDISVSIRLRTDRLCSVTTRHGRPVLDVPLHTRDLYVPLEPLHDAGYNYESTVEIVGQTATFIVWYHFGDKLAACQYNLIVIHSASDDA